MFKYVIQNEAIFVATATPIPIRKRKKDNLAFFSFADAKSITIIDATFIDCDNNDQLSIL